MFSTLVSFAQQDAQFSQNMFNHLSVNPAVAGWNKGICAKAFYRTQWLGFEGAPKTGLISIDFLAQGIGGIGLTLMSDKLGFEKNFEAKLAYSFQRELNNGSGRVGLGIDVGLIQKSIGGIWVAPTTVTGDAAIPAPSINGSTYDAGAGLFYTSRKAYLGLSANHIPQSVIQQGTVAYRYSPHYYVTAGWYQDITSSIVLNPSVFGKSDAASTQVDMNLRVIFNDAFWAGISYRFTDAFVAMIGCKRGFWKYGYSFDLTTSSLKKYSSNSHELFIGYCHPFTEKRQSHSNTRNMW